MEKIKINLNLMDNKIVKIGGNKIEVKPYILSTDMVEITNLCLEQFENNNEPFSALAWMKCFFDILVVYKCTNIKIDGIVEKENKNGKNISISLNSEITTQFEMSGIIEKVSPLIINYRDAYSQVMKVIETKNVYNAFNVLTRNLPSADEIQNALKNGVEEFNDVKKTYPDLVERVINENNLPQAQEKAKKELSNNIKKTKIKNLKNRK